MHYRNGRPAANGDKVVLLKGPQGGPVTGILYDAMAGNDFCNGRLAVMTTGDPYPNLKECLHVDDANALLYPKNDELK
jgi:predicted P-loop ATPase